MPGGVALRNEGRGGVLDKHHGEQGLVVTMAPGDLPKDLLQLSGSNRSDPRFVTVCFSGIEAAPNEGDEADTRLQARILWGTGKGFNEAFVDIKHGVQVSLVANIITAAIHYFGNNDGPTVRVSASSGYGSHPGGDSGATFTEQEVSLAAAAQSAALRVPNFATRVQWQSRNDPAVFVPVPMLRMFTGPTPADRIISQISPPPATWTTLPQGADFIRIRNDSDLAGYTLIYELGL
jgi:hypothetical protein